MDDISCNLTLSVRADFGRQILAANIGPPKD